MAMEKTTDWSEEKEAAAKNLPLAEKINPALHKTAKGNQKGKQISVQKNQETPSINGDSAEISKACSRNAQD